MSPSQEHWGPGKLKGLAFLKRREQAGFQRRPVSKFTGMRTEWQPWFYLFPRHEEISRGDRQVTFAAQLAGFYVSEVLLSRTNAVRLANSNFEPGLGTKHTINQKLAPAVSKSHSSLCFVDASSFCNLGGLCDWRGRPNQADGAQPGEV